MERLKIKDIKIEFLGYADERLMLGQSKGNKFRIVVRNLDKNGVNVKFLENYYDDQRFGGRNKLFGEALVKREFRKVCMMLRVKWKDNDFINALRNLGKKRLRFFVNSYQSYLWNETLAEYLRKEGTVVKEVAYSLGKLVFVADVARFLDLEVPLIGFGTSAAGKEIKEIMKKEDLDYRDFVIKQIPEITLEGEMRHAFVEVKDLKIGKEEVDDLNPGKNKVKVSFSLGKGSYATMVVRRIVNT